MATALDARKNALLAMLPEADLVGMLPQLHAANIRQGDVIYSQYKPLKLALFPLTAVMALQFEADGNVVKHVAMIGREGMVGTSFFLGGTAGFMGQAIALHSGVALAVSGTALMGHFARHHNVRMMLMHYTQSLMGQFGMNSLCAQFHLMDQRLARWVLESTDRVGQDTLRATHESLAAALSVHRPGVTLAARKLSEAGAVEYHRGTLTVKDRDRLLACACPCYKALIADYERLLPGASTLDKTAPSKGT